MDKIELIKSKDSEYIVLKYIKENFQDKPYSLIAYELNQRGFKNKEGNNFNVCNVKYILNHKLNLRKKDEVDLNALNKFESNKSKIDSLIKSNLEYSDYKIAKILNILKLFTQTGKEWTSNNLCQYRLSNEDLKKYEHYGTKTKRHRPKNGANMEKESLMLQTIKDNLDKADYEIVKILNSKGIKTVRGFEWTNINLYHYRITRDIYRSKEQSSLIQKRAGTKKLFYNNI
jgi:hypothetical protein